MPDHADGNLLLDQLLGATLHFEGAVDYDDIERSILAVAGRLAEAGRRPYAIPVGGASVVGAAAYALAVWGGLLGSIALLLKKRWATPVFAVSLAGVIVQDTALFGFTDAAKQGGAAVFILQGFVFVVCVALVQLSRKAVAAGWIA